MKKEEKKAEIKKACKKEIRANRMFNISLLVLFVASIALYYFTGWIFVLVLSPVFFGGSKYYRRSRYR